MVLSLTELFSILGRKRRPTASQKEILMKKFQSKPFLETEEKYELAMLLNLSEKIIANWFRTRRHETGQTSEQS